MAFSIRDEHSKASLLSGQRGQGLVEYILVLVVTVLLVLGGIYQLNSAFKVWAANYFGDYLACLLETGELPSVSGASGDSGICNQFFKSFSLADGRPMLTQLKDGNGEGSDGRTPSSTGGARENAGGGSRVSPNGGSGGGAFNSQRSSGGKKTAINNGNRKGTSNAYTGSTSSSDYGSGSGAKGNKIDTRVKDRLDNRFAFDNDREQVAKRAIASQSHKAAEEAGDRSKGSKVKRKKLKQDGSDTPESGMTFPDFIRWFLIAALIVVLLVYFGNQAMQISKSSE